MRVLWAPEAEQDRDDIWDTIAADDPLAAARMDQLFTEAAARLADFPMLGHPARSSAPANGSRVRVTD